MYPAGDLTELAQRKAVLQARIAIRRLECVIAAREIARPLAQVDRGLELWRRISPLVKIFAVPAGLLLTRFIGGRGGSPGRRRGGKLGALFSLLPLVLRGIEMVRGMRAAMTATKAGRVSPPTGPGP